GSNALSNFATINGATISGGSLTGGSVSGGSVSGGSLTGGTYSAAGATVAGDFSATIGDGNAFTISDGTHTLFTLAGAGTAGNLSGIANLNASGTITFSGLSDGVLTSASGVVTSTPQLAINKGGTGIGTAPTSGQLLIGNSSAGYSLATLTQGSGINITN